MIKKKRFRKPKSENIQLEHSVLGACLKTLTIGIAYKHIIITT
jgi:hypothetical protein